MLVGSGVWAGVRSSLIAISGILLLSACGGGNSNGGGGGGGITAVTVSPAHAAIVTWQTQQFSAAVSGDSQNQVSWSVDSVSGGNSSAGTIDSAGVYSPPATGGTHTITAVSTADAGKSDSATVAVTDLAGVFTYHNNLARDGTNTQEYALTPANVSATTFGKLFSCPVDGQAYTQPLWAPNLSIGGSAHNAIFVATQHDTAYSFDGDASPCLQLWRVNLLDSAHGAASGETTVPLGDVGNGFGDIQPEIGVTGTPVIDPVSKTLYLVSKSEDALGGFHQRLHALDLATGNEKFNGPVNISASVSGSGDDATAGAIAFNAQTEHQRCALALVNNVVYISWAAHEDKDPYHGWIIAYNAATLARVTAYNATPNGGRGGIWMSGGAPAADSAGNLYFATGNGTFDGNSGPPPNSDLGDSVISLTTSALTIRDWFTPFNQSALEINDTDLGSSGVVLLPDQSPGTAHLLIAGGKEGKLYLLNRDSMGHFCASCTTATGDTNALQSFKPSPAIFGTPAFWQDRLYLGGTGDTLKLFSFDTTSQRVNTTPASQSSIMFNFPGPSPSISASGASNGIVWVIDSSRYGPPSSQGTGPSILHAYDAMNLGSEVWNSSLAASNRDLAGNAVKFTVPTIANGKVYIGTSAAVDVYGLLP